VCEDVQKYQIPLRNSPDANLYRVFNSPLDESIGVGKPDEWKDQKELLSEKITLSQLQSKFSFAQGNFFLTCFLDSSSFFSLLQISLHEPVNVFL